MPNYGPPTEHIDLTAEEIKEAFGQFWGTLTHGLVFEPGDGYSELFHPGGWGTQYLAANDGKYPSWAEHLADGWCQDETD